MGEGLNDDGIACGMRHDELCALSSTVFRKETRRGLPGAPLAKTVSIAARSYLIRDTVCRASRVTLTDIKSFVESHTACWNMSVE